MTLLEGRVTAAQVTADFPSETVDAGRKWHSTTKFREKITVNPKFYVQQNYSGEMKENQDGLR